MIPAIGELLLASVTAFGLWKVLQFVYQLFTSPLRHLRGPGGASWILGNLRDFHNDEDSVPGEEWVKQHGSTLTFKGAFYSDRLLTVDLRAVNHVLTHSNSYQKPSQLRYDLSQIFGEGLLLVEGARHRHQRHIMNPAFGPAQVRALTDIFLEKAVRLRDVWLSEAAKNPGGATIGTRLNVMPWLNRMTLDVIGLAGFNYNFDALNANQRPNELNKAFAAAYAARRPLSILALLQARFSLLRLLPSDRARKAQVAQCTMARIGKELLASAKAAARENAIETGENGNNSMGGRDLLSLLVKANTATDIPDNQRLCDKDVLAQVPTFLAAGYETTSVAATWALYALANAPEIQTKLREELLSVDTEAPSMDELIALPYLDAVVREILRLHSPVYDTLRVAMKDDVLPVAKPFTDKNGVIRDSVSVSKGDQIVIPILAINRSQEVWGPDAHEFKPERWQNVPEGVSQVPGVWGHQLTFLGGSRACIGYRFALVELKILVFTLVRAFEFEFAVPASDIGIRWSSMAQRPVLRSDPKRKPQLPLLLKPFQRK